jgi:hypothetical protein
MAAAGLIAVGVLAGASPGFGAMPAGSPAGGPIQIFVNPGNGVTGSIVITGAIGDYGKTLNMDKNGKPNANGNYVKLTLKKGTFEVNLTKLNAKTNNVPPTLNKSTCSFSFVGSGPVTFFQGTGLYTGISGGATITVRYGGVGPVFATGTHKGQCNLSDSAKLLAQATSIQGTGTVRFG